jgi:hypothetical protein
MMTIAVARGAALAAAVVAAACYLPFASASYGAGPPPSRLAISAVASSAHGALSPGHSVPVRVTLTNDTEHPLDLDPGTIEGSVSPFPRGCVASWFRFTSGDGTAIVVAGDGGTATVTGRLSFVETNTNQSACAGAKLGLSLSVR